MADDKLQAAVYDEQIGTIKDAAAKSIDPCLTAKFIAASDNRVRTVFLKKIQDGYVFRGIVCLHRLSIPENHYVYFDFDCKPGTVCLIKPAFAAVVNVVDGYVVAVLDPYMAKPAEFWDADRALTRVSVELDIDIDVRSSDTEVCAKVTVAVKAGGASGKISFPEVCLSEEGLCSHVSSGGGDLRGEAEVCWKGTKICAEVTVKIKLFGKWYEGTATKCVDI